MTDKVAFLDLRSIMLAHAPRYRTAFERVLQSGWFILGNELQSFEEAYADYCSASHCVGVANGLDAMTLTLLAMDIGPGDEVIVPSNTYIATWLAVTHTGAVPVPVEPDDESFNIDPARIEAAITSRTRAILPVHLYGQAADLQPILAIAARHGLKVIEDAAQAHGARYHGERIGAHSDAVCWSFYPGKNLGCLGDGGAVTTRSPEIADRVRVLRNYGSRVKYQNDVIGANSRLDELQAAFLSSRLPELEAENERRRSIAARYGTAFASSTLRCPTVSEGNIHAWHLYVVRHPDRATLAQRLAERGIATMIHYPIPPHLQLAYQSMKLGVGSLPISERMHREVLSLPLGPTMTDDDVDRVIEATLASLG